MLPAVLRPRAWPVLAVQPGRCLSPSAKPGPAGMLLRLSEGGPHAAGRAVDWREQSEATIAGQVPAAMPAVLRMSRWYKARQHLNDWPAEVAGCSLPAIEAYLGMARSARYAKIHHVRFRPPAEQIVRRNGPELITEYRINGRSLVRVQRFNGDDEAFGLEAAIAEYPIRSAPHRVSPWASPTWPCPRPPGRTCWWYAIGWRRFGAVSANREGSRTTSADHFTVELYFRRPAGIGIEYRASARDRGRALSSGAGTGGPILRAGFRRHIW